jgi:hypothetical protein
MTKSDTKRGEFVFTIKEFADGTPWITAEPRDDKAVELFGEGFIGFDLPKGTDYTKAKAIARYLNENVKSLSLTNFEK